jgi:DNA-directed RNA polymerase subunit E'/Rpb7
MIVKKNISVLLNLNPKYLHKDLIIEHINDLIEKNILNNCFPDLGKVLKIKKIISIGLGKIHIDTGFSKTPVTFEAELCYPKTDEILKGIIEKYDSNCGIYVNYKNILSIFCLNTNLNSLFDDISSKNKKKLEKNGFETRVKVKKININDKNDSVDSDNINDIIDNVDNVDSDNINYKIDKNDSVDSIESYNINNNIESFIENNMEELIGREVKVKITKVNITEQNMIVIGKLV